MTAQSGGSARDGIPSEVERLLGTRAGLALAHAAWREGHVATLDYCNDDGREMKPTNPYLAPLRAAQRGDRPRPTVPDPTWGDDEPALDAALDCRLHWPDGDETVCASCGGPL